MKFFLDMYVDVDRYRHFYRPIGNTHLQNEPLSNIGLPSCDYRTLQHRSTYRSAEIRVALRMSVALLRQTAHMYSLSAMVSTFLFTRIYAARNVFLNERSLPFSQSEVEALALSPGCIGLTTASHDGNTLQCVRPRPRQLTSGASSRQYRERSSYRRRYPQFGTLVYARCLLSKFTPRPTPIHISQSL